MDDLCNNTAFGNGFVYVCDRPKGHRGLHAQRTQLRDGISTTNWGDDGRAPHATHDTQRLRESGRR